MDEYKKNLYYAKQGDALAQNVLMVFCSVEGMEDYPFDISISKYWADKLKENAENGNTLAQYDISDINIQSNEVVDRYMTHDTRDDIIGLKNKYQGIIKQKISENDPEALFAEGDRTSDLEMIKKAAELGSSLACERLVRYYCLGGWDGNINFSNSDRNAQFLYAQKGAQLNDYYACRCQEKLANCHREGIGTSVDYQQYLLWIEKAAKNGSYEAQEVLNNINRNTKPIQSKSATKEGCYVATCVYGSYDCPSVWVLRRFRDTILLKTRGGKIFVKIYYYISPKLVSLFGKTKIFNYIFKKILDKIVYILKKRGITDFPYENR